MLSKTGFGGSVSVASEYEDEDWTGSNDGRNPLIYCREGEELTLMRGIDKELLLRKWNLGIS